jgi:ubiquinone/menaquinone biosynthesis C-methylase UbiE
VSLLSGRKAGQCQNQTNNTVERYTPGHTLKAVEFMARRVAETHAAFLLPYLKPGLSVLDCGCGPGTITLGLASRVAPGAVIGIDAEPSQVVESRNNAASLGLQNMSCRVATVYELPFESDTFHVVFAHALFDISRTLFGPCPKYDEY